MRVPLIKRRRNGDETGAVAAMVAILSVVILGFAAFAVDFGMTYANGRVLQNAADAAALGAAGVYSETESLPGCESLLAEGRLAASEEADAKVDANSNDSLSAEATGRTFEPECTEDGLKVRVTTEFQSPSFFGRVFGSEGYAITRSASAMITAADGVGPGLRPMALCSRDLHTMTVFPPLCSSSRVPPGAAVPLT
jgi:uncharacterized membrane protein